MRSRFLWVLCCLTMLLTVTPALPSCSGREPGDSAITETDQSSAAAKADELLGSWMLLSGDNILVYTFRADGELVLYEMESATVVRERLSGSYTLIGNRLTVEIGGSRKSYSVLTDKGRALILDGEILTPTAEPEH